MPTLKTPAPLGAPGLDYGNTTVRPYSPSRPHRGKDWQWRLANPFASRTVVAGVSGTVIAAYNDGRNHEGWGNYIDILIPSTTHRIVRRLAHHATGSVLVRIGQQVGDDTRIGTMGNTGEAHGVHLHEELWINGVRVDPNPYYTQDLPGTGGEAAGGGEKPFTPDKETPKRKRKTMDFIIYVGKGDALKRQYKLEGGLFRLLTPTERNAIDLAAAAVGETVHVIEITNTAIANQGVSGN